MILDEYTNKPVIHNTASIRNSAGIATPIRSFPTS